MQPGDNRADNRQYPAAHRTTDRARGTRPPSKRRRAPAGHFVAPSRSISLRGRPVRKEKSQDKEPALLVEINRTRALQVVRAVSTGHYPPSTAGGWTWQWADGHWQSVLPYSQSASSVDRPLSLTQRLVQSAVSSKMSLGHFRRGRTGDRSKYWITLVTAREVLSRLLGTGSTE